jgi:pyruvate ferredoxin oxidoreductase gamma subunit
MFRIRFHGRGGQGIKTASRILGSAFFQEGYEVQDAPRYGAERRGAPIFAYVRAALAPIRERGNITRPDLVVVADETLVPVPAAGVTQGVAAATVLLINSAETPEVWIKRLNYPGPVVTLPVTEAAADRAELPYIGARCVGAAARLVGVITRESLAQAVRTELADHGEEVVRRNTEQAQTAYDRMAEHAGRVAEGASIAADGYTPPHWIDVPLDDVHHAAPDIERTLTTVEVRTGLWRTMRPVIDYSICHKCSWVCSTLCPDSAIRVLPDGRPEIDYDHCKGCLICVSVCPPHAISAIPEVTARAVEKTA